jgi:hypothetical protein
LQGLPDIVGDVVIVFDLGVDVVHNILQKLRSESVRKINRQNGGERSLLSRQRATFGWRPFETLPRRFNQPCHLEKVTNRESEAHRKRLSVSYSGLKVAVLGVSEF